MIDADIIGGVGSRGMILRNKKQWFYIDSSDITCARTPGWRVLVQRFFWAILACLVFAPTSWAARIVQFSPQGAVSQIQEISLSFDTDVTAFGEGQGAAPIILSCNDKSVKGAARWLDARRWTYVFDSEPGPGLRCTATLDPAFRAVDDKSIVGPASFSFQTGGPIVDVDRPYGQTIDEDQVFVLKFNGKIDADSILKHTYCLVEGYGEAVPVRLITGQMRTQVLDAVYYGRGSQEDTAATQLVQCKRKLPAEAHVQLRIDAGISTLGTEQRSSVSSNKAVNLDYTVRKAFTASFSCLRENANKPCTPVSPVNLEFSAPVARADAAKIRLNMAGSALSPDLDPQDSDHSAVRQVRFSGPFAADTTLSLVLPEGLKDDAGRTLENADRFPLSFRTADFPPLVKFAAAPFGVIERFAAVPPGGDEAAHPATMALTVRNVEQNLMTRDLALSAGSLRDYSTQDDADVLKMYARVLRLDEGRLTRAQIKNVMIGRAPGSGKGDAIDTRGISALSDKAESRKLVLPGATQDPARPFEVIGVPLDKPGFHVLEIESPRLGESLLSTKTPMYVRTTALLTNLAVHIKTGRDDTLVWVTTLDDGKVVSDASVTVLDCRGKLLAQGKTDENGIWHEQRPLDDSSMYCEDTGLSGIYASARIDAAHPLARGHADFSFALSSWDSGIESWRFNVPTDSSPLPTTVTHTVFDRTLLRAGETVSMKHFIREQTRQGLQPPVGDETSKIPSKLVITHQGSDQQYEQPVSWIPTATGGMYATSAFAIPKTAKLGMYSATLQDEEGNWYGSGEFRVEEFKLPLLSGHIKVSAPDQGEGAALIAPQTLTADVQISYVSGGPAGKLPVSLSGVVRNLVAGFRDYDGFSFAPPSDQSDDQASGGDADDDASRQRLFLDKKAVTLDAQGGGRIHIDGLPKTNKPQELLFEASFFDPNGELQTLSQTTQVWPAALQTGINAGGAWLQVGKPGAIHAIAVTHAGKPLSNVAITVRAVARETYSTRKRMVGGFYSYDNQTNRRDLGQVCEGKTGADGRIICQVTMMQAGSVELIASAKDGQGRVSASATSTWVTGADDLWFGGANDDRIDIIPSRKEWKPGEQAQFQVQMPYRHATALVAVEREGILETHVVALDGENPTVTLPVKAEWGPNVYVSVLALRGRLREASLRSFFDWGWRSPTAWYRAFRRDGQPYTPPTPFVDLSKPSFRFGLAQIRVADTEDQLLVDVKTDKKSYQIRNNVSVDIQVRTPDGQPAAHGSVAFAAVDQALLELAPNNSWNLLEAMRQERSYGVRTATAQMQVVGRRHYGRKALPAGGGGGKSPTRELLDTLLLWEPAVDLDENGRATLTFPLNDSLTRFKLVAIADYGPARFGTGAAEIVSTQDLQVISGLPEMVREGDTYQATATLRNTTARTLPLNVEASYKGKGVESAQLPVQQISVPAGEARTVFWSLQAPQSNLLTEATALAWTLDAREATVSATDASSSASGQTADQTNLPKAAFDRLLVHQQLLSAVPVRTRQATLMSLDPNKPAVDLPVAIPAGALKDTDGKARGGLQIHIQSSLAGGLPGVREWLQAYPYTCLEQRSSKAMGLGQTSVWGEIMRSLPDYLDADGLASYFPGAREGSEVLTAYLLSISHHAQALGLDFAIPQSSMDRMTSGLQAFVQGRLVRHRWSPQKDLDMRKLMALEALSQYGLMTPRMLDSIDIAPDRWPTSGVIDWMSILQRLENIPGRAQKYEQAGQVLRARMSGSGTGLIFADNTQNDSWWLMSGPQANMAKFMLLAMDDKAWEDEVPRLAIGLLSMQRKGAWNTTTANLLGTLALEKFASKYERAQVTGSVHFDFASGGRHEIAWRNTQKNKQGVRSGDVLLPWPAKEQDALQLSQQGEGRAWVSIQSLAAVPTVKAVNAGYTIKRTVVPVDQRVPGDWTRGDVYRVKMQVHANAPMSWVVLSDPLPAGATILGSGLGRDSAIAASGETNTDYWSAPSFVERSFEAYRAYYEYLPKGDTTIEYTVRLNTAGRFALPPTRIEALYQPDVYGELPHAGAMEVKPTAAAGS